MKNAISEIKIHYMHLKRNKQRNNKGDVKTIKLSNLKDRVTKDAKKKIKTLGTCKIVSESLLYM